MKKLLLYLVLLLASLPALSQNGPGNDTTKYIWYKFQYGIRYQRAQFDSVLIPPKDTTYAKAGIATKNGIFFYWDGTKWTSPGGGTGGSITAVVGSSPVTANTRAAAVGPVDRIRSLSFIKAQANGIFTPTAPHRFMIRRTCRVMG
jgi:hypothetical protein